MKNTAIISLTVLGIFTSAALAGGNTPPVPPGFMSNSVKGKEMPKSCSSIPPMLINYPPPMEEELYACLNDYYAPELEEIAPKIKALLETKSEVVSVVPLEGFKRLYKITLVEGDMKSEIYCNEDASVCIKGELLK